MYIYIYIYIYIYFRLITRKLCAFYYKFFLTLDFCLTLKDKCAVCLTLKNKCTICLIL